MRILGITASGVMSFPSFLVFGSLNANAWSSTDGVTWDFRQAQRATGTGTEVYWSGIVNSKLYTAESTYDFIYSSTDGTAWSQEKWSIGTSARVGAPFINYVNGKWVLCSSDIIYNSTDAVTWTANSTSLSAQAPGTQVIYDGTGTYLVGGNTNTVWSSTDLVTWTSRLVVSGGTDIDSVAYGNGVWLVRVDDDVALTNRIYTSTNLTTWTNRLSLTDPALSGNLEGLVYGNGLYAAAVATSLTDRIYTSTNATTWTQRTVTGGTFTKVGFANNYLFGFDNTNNKIAYSTDGVTWTSRTVSAADAGTEFNSVQYFNSKYYLFGVYDTTDGTPVYSSTDLVTWAAVSDTNSVLGKMEGYQLNGAILANNKYYFVGNSSYIVEANSSFSTWTTRTSAHTGNIFGITYGVSTLVAVGQGGQLQTSTDGTTWTSRTSTFGTTAINKVAFGNSTFVAVGNAGQARTSTDGVTWTTRTSGFGTSAILNLRYVNSNFITMGESGIVGNSTDGITWTTRRPNANTTNSLDIAYGAGVYVLAKENNIVYTSTDLTTWTTRTSTLSAGQELTTSLFSNNIFVILQDSTPSSAAKFTTYQTSTDGITWTSRTLASAGASDASYNFGSVTLAGQGIAL